MEYTLDMVCTGNHRADEVNSTVLAWADDIAEKLTEQECELNGIDCYITEMEGDVEVQRYTEEAQDIFNIHYDEHVDSLYKFVNAILKIQEPTKKEKTLERLGEYVSTDLELDYLYDVLVKARDNGNGDKMADDYVDMWEPMEGRYTVTQLIDEVTYL